MRNVRVIIKNYKCIKECNIDLSSISFLIGSNGTGKSTIIDAISYFYLNLTQNNISQEIFDKNNYFSNSVSITLIYDLRDIIKRARISLKTFDFDDYLNDIISLEEYNNGILRIELSQIKNKKIEWNVDYRTRSLIKSLFPLFNLNSHIIDYYNWDTVWDMFADLNKISNDEKNSLIKELKNVVDMNTSISNKINKTMKILENEKIYINNFTTKSFTKNLQYLYFSGNKLTKNRKDLTYYSDGETTINYLSVFFSILDEISNIKMKKPIIMLDEPEISLHPTYIKRLANIICKHAINLYILVSTHSPQLVKTATSTTMIDNIYLYNVMIDKNYTKIKKMRSIAESSSSEKYRILNDHISSYFSKGILFVEGESELELFGNEYLQLIFPILEKIDVLKAMTDEKIFKNIDPGHIHTWVPCLYLFDLDKVLKYEKNKNKLTLIITNGQVNRNREVVKFFNSKNNKFDLRLIRIRLNQMANKLKIHYAAPFYSCNDDNYCLFKYILKEYMLEYNYFILDTTIEGVLINNQTKDIYIDFIRDNFNKTYNDIIDEYKDLTEIDKINLLRMVTNGKSDLLINLKNYEKDNNTAKNIKKIGKTEGWISKFICYYIERKTDCKSIQQFYHFIKNDNGNFKMIFKDDFYELSTLVTKLYDMMNVR